MGRKPTYRVQFRRKRSGKTNYRQRLRLLKSGKPRLVVRKTQQHMIVQLIKTYQTGDKVLAAAHTHELVQNYGWLGHCGNLPAAYLAGLLCGLRAREKRVKNTVLDIGLHTYTKGARIFAVLKGAIDAGLRIPHSGEILPNEERIRGRHIADYATKLKKDAPEKYRETFSQYLERNLKPEQLPRHLEEVKKKIIASFEG